VRVDESGWMESQELRNVFELTLLILCMLGARIGYQGKMEAVVST
jgi:hypothetical protein